MVGILVNSIRKAPTILAVHLGQNDRGITPETLKLINQKLKTRPIEDMAKFTKVSNFLKKLCEGNPVSLTEGVISKANRGFNQSKSAKREENLVLQRVIGLKDQQPGSG